MRLNFRGWPGLVRASYHDLPDDPQAQTEATISLMGALAAADARASSIQALAARISGSSGSESAIAAGAWEWVRRHVTFTRDVELAQGIEGWGPRLVEVLIRPVDLITMSPARGDCDDFSMLVASLLMACGIPCSFACVAADPLEPDRYSHVYVVAHLSDGDMALDASHGRFAGWEAPNQFGKRDLWRVDGMIGLGQETVPTFSTTVTESSRPWWQDLIFEGVDIARDRIGLPENTYRVDQGGVLSRGSATAPAAVPVTDVRTSGSFFAGGQSWIFIIAAVLLLVVLMNSKGGRK